MKKRELLIILIILIVSLGIIFLTSKDSKKESAGEEEKGDYVFKIDRNSLKSLKISFERKEEYSFFKKGDHWKMVGAREANIDNLVEDLFSTIGSIEKIKIEEMQGNAEAKEFGLDSPRMKLTLENTNRVQSLIIGDMHPSKGTYYAKLEGEKEIFFIGSLYPSVIRPRVNNLLLFIQQAKK
jgi:hypothetical protein